MALGRHSVNIACNLVSDIAFCKYPFKAPTLEQFYSILGCDDGKHTARNSFSVNGAAWLPTTLGPIAHKQKLASNRGAWQYQDVLRRAARNFALHEMLGTLGSGISPVHTTVVTSVQSNVAEFQVVHSSNPPKPPSRFCRPQRFFQYSWFFVSRVRTIQLKIAPLQRRFQSSGKAHE